MLSILIAYLVHYHSLSQLILLTSTLCSGCMDLSTEKHMARSHRPFEIAIWAQVTWTYVLITLALKLHGPILILENEFTIQRLNYNV